MKYAIGIDPGMVQTGLVLRRMCDNRIMARGTFSCRPGAPAFERVIALSGKIIDEIVGLLKEDPDINRLDIAIETPIYKSNPRSFELQWRLVQAIEEGIVYRIEPELTECWITEVPPSTSKRLSTGSGQGNKPQIAAASPFVEKDFKNTDTFYTIADAWSHSLAAWQGCRDCVRINCHMLKIMEVGD